MTKGQTLLQLELCDLPSMCTWCQTKPRSATDSLPNLSGLSTLPYLDGTKQDGKRTKTLTNTLGCEFWQWMARESLFPAAGAPLSPRLRSIQPPTKRKQDEEAGIRLSI